MPGCINLQAAAQTACDLQPDRHLSLRMSTAKFQYTLQHTRASDTRI